MEIIKELKCKFCHYETKNVKIFNNHKCKLMTRHEEMKTTRGQSAYSLYASWFRTKEMKIPDIDTFLNSQYYTTFLKFSDFQNEQRINSIDLYISYVVNRKLTPALWTNRQVYGDYIKTCINDISKEDQINITITWMDKLAGENNCTIKEIIDLLPPYNIMDSIRQAKFLPWYFLNSPKFAKKLKLFPKDLQDDYQNTIDGPYWRFQMEKNPEFRIIVKDIVKKIELGSKPNL